MNSRTVVAACVVVTMATSWTGACTTTVVDFAAFDGRTPQSPVVPVADASQADVLGDGGTPDASISVPREITNSFDDQFREEPVAGPARYVQYKCCDEAGEACTIWIQGDGTTCRNAEEWNMNADAHCLSRGLIAMGVGLFRSC